MPNIFQKTTSKQPTLSQLERADKEAGYSKRASVSGKAGASIGNTVVPTLASINRIDAARMSATSPSGHVSGNVSGGVGRQKTLNENQRSDAALVAKLPEDFPIDNWEKLNHNQQRKAMLFSGLDDQEQWQLLNASAPLKVLADMNAAQAEPYRKDASILTSLQNGLLRERIEAAFEIAKTRTASSPVNGPQSTPRPGNTPLPVPGRSVPVTTPMPRQNEPNPKFPLPESLPTPPGTLDPMDRYTWYHSYQQAAEAWAAINRPLSKDYERCALIYRNIDSKGNERFTFGKTKAGMKGIPALKIRDNVALPFVSLYLGESVPRIFTRRVYTYTPGTS